MNARPEKDGSWRQPGEVSKANTTREKHNSRSTKTEAQIERLLEMLRTNPRHTHELRKAGISHPAGRVKDLIGRGYCVDSCRTRTVDSDGFIHVRVALYELISEPMGGAA